MYAEDGFVVAQHGARLPPVCAVCLGEPHTTKTLIVPIHAGSLDRNEFRRGDEWYTWTVEYSLCRSCAGVRNRDLLRRLAAAIPVAVLSFWAATLFGFVPLLVGGMAVLIIALAGRPGPPLELDHAEGTTMWLFGPSDELLALLPKRQEGTSGR